ncbi:MAG: tetratricopeptide repeat protein [Chlorobi bacterium]|nr:tetratricopeptide repeat protein [Chlorobiota bacterium]
MTTAHFTLYAQRLLGAGKTSDAIAMLEEGIKEYPDYATAYALLARAYLQLNDVPTAYDVATSAVARFPTHRGLQLLAEQLEELLRSEPELAPPIDEPVATSRDVEDASTSETPQSEGAFERTSIIPDSSVSIAEHSTPTPANQEDIGEHSATSIHSEAEQETSVILQSISNESTSSETVTQIEQNEDRIDAQATDEFDACAEDLTDNSTPPAVFHLEPTTASSATPEHVDTPSHEIPTAEMGHAAEVQLSPPTLRIVETAVLDSRAMRMLRASNIRLVPGLEFAPLRIESAPQTEPYPSLEYPPFRPIRGSQRHRQRLRRGVPATPTELEAELRARLPSQPESHSQKTSLELLAEQLERVRIKSNDSPSTPPTDSGSDEPSFVSETMATIYERQGALEQAIKAYTALARIHPERRQFYEEKIAQLRARKSLS